MNRAPDLLVPEITFPGGIRESAVRFGPPEEQCVGNLLLPAQAREPGLIFIHGWSGVRSGPHGLLTTAARRLAAEGFPSLRFDLSGRGESHGNGTTADLPRMAENVRAAAAFFRKQTGVRRLVLFGLCSGGNVAIGVLPSIPDVAGLVLLSVYPFSDGDRFSRDVHRTWHFLRVYWHKMRQPETWRRLTRGEIHFKQIFHVLFGHYRKKKTDRAEANPASPGPAPAAAESAPPQSASQPRPGNASAPASPPKKHLENLRCGVPALMLYGTADPDAAAAEEYYRSFAEANRLPIAFLRIQGANHNFSSVQWKDAVIRHALEFCNDLGPNRSRPGRDLTPPSERIS